MPQHRLGLVSLLRFFDFMLCESCFRRERQNRFGLELPEAKVGHALVIVLEHDVAILVVYHGTKLLKLLQRDDRCNSALIKPHLFEISE